VASIDDRLYLRGFQEFTHSRQVILAWLCQKCDQFLAGKSRRNKRRETAHHRAQSMPSRRRNQDLFPLGIQNPPACRERTIPHTVENDIVTPAISGEVFLGVIDHRIRTYGSAQLQIPGTAPPSHISVECLCNLHGERAYASRRAID